MRTRPEPRSLRGAILVARDSHATFFLVALAGKCRLQFRFLTRRDEKRMLLRILDDFLCHHFPLKPAQCAFNRFTLINSHYSHSFLTFLLQFSEIKLI